MLPITTQRSFHIPHSLATAAALLGLVAAFSMDPSDPKASRLSATNEALDHVGAVKAAQAEPATETQKPVPADANDYERGVFSGLLPLVLPGLSGH